MKIHIIVLLNLFIVCSGLSQSWLQSRCVRNYESKIESIKAYTSTIECDEINNDKLIDSLRVFRFSEYYNDDGKISKSIDNNGIETSYIYEIGILKSSIKTKDQKRIEEKLFTKIGKGLTKVTFINEPLSLSYFLQTNEKGQQISNYKLDSKGDTVSVRYITYNENDLPLSISAYTLGKREYCKLFTYNSKNEAVKTLHINEDGEIENYESRFYEKGLNSAKNDKTFIKDRNDNIVKLIMPRKNSNSCSVWTYEIEYLN